MTTNGSRLGDGGHHEAQNSRQAQM